MVVSQDLENDKQGRFFFFFRCSEELQFKLFDQKTPFLKKSEENKIVAKCTCVPLDAAMAVAFADKAIPVPEVFPTCKHDPLIISTNTYFT